MQYILQKLRKLQWPKIVDSDMMRTGKLTQKTTEPVLHWDIIQDVEEIYPHNKMQPMPCMQEAEC